MVTIRYAEGKGWYEPRVEARAPIPMDPAAAVLHYAQEIFEGLKAYTMPDGGVAMFRPDANAARFAPVGAADGHAGAAAGHVPASRCARSSRSTATGSRRARRAASTCARSRTRARSSSGVRPAHGIPLPGHRVPGRRLLHRRRQAGLGVGHPRLHPRRARRHRRGQVRRQLRGRPRPPRPRPSSTAATRSSTWTRSSASTSTSSAA